MIDASTLGRAPVLRGQLEGQPSSSQGVPRQRVNIVGLAVAFRPCGEWNMAMSSCAQGLNTACASTERPSPGKIPAVRPSFECLYRSVGSTRLWPIAGTPHRQLSGRPSTAGGEGRRAANALVGASAPRTWSNRSGTAGGTITWSPAPAPPDALQPSCQGALYCANPASPSTRIAAFELSPSRLTM